MSDSESSDYEYDPNTNSKKLRSVKLNDEERNEMFNFLEHFEKLINKNEDCSIISFYQDNKICYLVKTKKFYKEMWSYVHFLDYAFMSNNLIKSEEGEILDIYISVRTRKIDDSSCINYRIKQCKIDIIYLDTFSDKNIVIYYKNRGSNKIYKQIFYPTNEKKKYEKDIIVGEFKRPFIKYIK